MTRRHAEAEDHPLRILLNSYQVLHGSSKPMTTPRPFALRLFVPSGLPEGMRIVEKTN